MKSLVMSALLGLTVVGCALKPLDGDIVNGSAVDFSGYALEANQAVTIEGFDLRTNSWVAITTVHAGSTVNMTWGGEEWYAWDAPDVNTLNPGSSCFWGEWNPVSSRCLISPGGDSARFRVSGGGFQFFSYQKGYEECIGKELGKGEPQSRAAITCASPNSPEIGLSIIN